VRKHNPFSVIGHWSFFILLVITSAAIGADVYPTEAWPSSATIDALNGTMDDSTGLPFIAEGTSPESAVPYLEQIDRRLDRQNAILAGVNTGRVVRVDDTHVGAFPADFRLDADTYHYPGETSVAITATDDTYYVYLDSDSDEGGNGDVTVVTDATGWPAGISTYIPLAEVTVSSNIISAIVDRRSRAMLWAPPSGAGSISGTDQPHFIIDQDNAGAGVITELRFNRGSTDTDAYLKWNESSDAFNFFENTTTSAAVSALRFTANQNTGTAPFTVWSTTKVTYLNADMVDGLTFTAPAAAGGIAYSTGTSAVAFSAAGSAGDVLISAGAAVPTWEAVGTSVQATDGDLDAIAAVATTGLLARTASDTWATRTLTSGTGSLTITYGDGVAGNPVLTIDSTANQVPYGDSDGVGFSYLAHTDNTVLVGQTGTTPTFRKLVNADISTSAEIDTAKLAQGGSNGDLLVTDGSTVTWVGMGGDANIDETGSLLIDGTQYGVPYSLAGGAGLGWEVGTDNQVLCARTGNTPQFRTIVNADVNAGADIAVTKLAAGTDTQVLLNNGTTPTWTTLTGDVTVNGTGATTVGAGRLDSGTFDTSFSAMFVGGIGWTIGSEASDTINVSVQLKDLQSDDNLVGQFVIHVMLTDNQYATAETGTAATSLAATTGAVLRTITANKRIEAITTTGAVFAFDIEYTGGAKTWYLSVWIDGRVRASAAVTFA